MSNSNNETETLSEQLDENIKEQQSKQSQHPPFILTQTSSTETSSNQILIHSKFITHNPKAGINPLTDAAAYIFSSIGKLSFLKSYRNLNKLQKELITEINTFQESAKAQGYSTEYILVSRYALCATLDDIIKNTEWGEKGQWDEYNMVSAFNQETFQADRFFFILERITKDPKMYIDLMEFMYICLSLGYKGNYRTVKNGELQLEKITHSLYKHIKARKGNFSKKLSPFIIKPSQNTKKKLKKISYTYSFLITASVIMLLFIGLGYVIDTLSKQAYKDLINIGKTIFL
ncbi:type IVB secretion system protein IcmH/DotU [Gammaproteobacteria bacterium]|nr:type IVB secretion system protein IcmH/DotU [Gammaproteobacteria bacterium]